MRYAIVENNYVVNVVEARTAAYPNWIPCDGLPAAIGGTYDGAFHLQPQPTPPPVNLVPQSVTMRQARLVLNNTGKLATVNAAIAAMPGPTGDAARIEWEYSSTVERGKPLVAAMGGILGMDNAALDALFIAAAAL